MRASCEALHEEEGDEQGRQERAPIPSVPPGCWAPVLSPWQQLPSHPGDPGGLFEPVLLRQAGRASALSSVELCHVQYPSPYYEFKARGPRMYIYLSDILKMSPCSEH